MIGLWRPLAGIFYANLGAVKMARIQLKGWSALNPQLDLSQMSLKPAETAFLESLEYTSHQATALYRLGMIASEQGDYEQARQYLSQAIAVYPAHYGIRKLLGYSYLWLGDVDQAARYLTPDSETLKELDSYTYWWTTQNRPDLSSLAGQASDRLRTIGK